MDNTGRTSRAPRLVVGISRSRASWWALSWAIGEARRRRARLLLVHLYRPSWHAPLDTGQGCLTGIRDCDADRAAYARMLIQAAIGQAAGQLPGDVTVEQAVLPGRVAAELAGLARGGDVIVLGARHRGWPRRLAPGSVARACARLAECPVVSVPEPSPRALSAAAPGGAPRHHRFRWVPRHEAGAAAS
jgi:nucleotide-binding universal stress UspA family protein